MIEREEQQFEDCWDLSPLFPSISAWDAEFSLVETDSDALSSFQGKLSEGVEAISAAFECYLEMKRRLERLYVYAHLESDQDVGNAAALGRLDRVTGLCSRVASKSSYLIPELLSLSSDSLEDALGQPQLQHLKRFLEEIIRYKPFTLSANEEQLLALGAEVFGSSRKIFSQLNNADFSFGNINVDGNSIELTHGNFVVLLKHPSRKVREQAFNNYYEVFEQHKNSLSAVLSSSLKKDHYLAKVRRFSSVLEQQLYGDMLTQEVYDNLISTVEQHLAPLHRYYVLRAKTLGLEDLKIYDTYVSLVPETSFHFTYEEAASLTLSAVACLGEEYTVPLRRGLLEARWVDRFENKGKRSGAYSSGCYESPPYILMNFNENDISSVFTLAHEAGHSMHSYFSSRNQSYQDHAYTIFVAEVASTFNEMLLTRELMKRFASDKNKQLFLVNQQLDDIKATFYRQVMFAEFEREMHECQASGSPLTIDEYRSVYRRLLSKYFGTAVTLGPLDDLECLRIPHFYTPFYVYKYATGLAAAIALAERVTSGEKQAVSSYLSFLKAGCSKHPLELLKDAGVDMTEETPLVSALALFERRLERLENLLRGENA